MPESMYETLVAVFGVALIGLIAAALSAAPS